MTEQGQNIWSHLFSAIGGLDMSWYVISLDDLPVIKEGTYEQGYRRAINDVLNQLYRVRALFSPELGQDIWSHIFGAVGGLNTPWHYISLDSASPGTYEQGYRRAINDVLNQLYRVRALFSTDPTVGVDLGQDW